MFRSFLFASPRQLIVPRRFNSSFDQLSKLLEQTAAKKPETGKESSTLSHVNDLLSNTNNINRPPQENSSTYDFSNITKHPREVARSIKIQGPSAGRVATVRGGNVGIGINRLKSTVRKERIQIFQKLQARYIRPAKLRKLKKSRWWRQTFSSGFKELMAQVADARRRGY